MNSAESTACSIRASWRSDVGTGNPCPHSVIFVLKCASRSVRHGANGVARQAELRNAYRNVRQVCQRDWRSDEASIAIGRLAVLALRFLSERANPVTLRSSVAGKNFISFSRNDVVARPANRDLFELDAEYVEEHWRSWREQPTATGFERLAYTVALAPCLAFELMNRNNKKGPATYFECLVGHIFARSLDLEPTRHATLPVLGQRSRMTMDFLFERAEGVANIHLPIKMSTRERIVQAWAHQRVLDATFGLGHYQGIMVLFSETKLDSRTLDVVEICVPDQWLIYQTLLAKMHCIYYFDMPVRYRELARTHPEVIQIKPIGDLLTGVAAFAAR